MDDVAPKPIQFQQLLNTIETLTAPATEAATSAAA